MVSLDRICYSIPEAAKAAGIGTTKLREEIAAKRLVARKIGKRTVVNAPDLLAWSANLPQAEYARRVA